MVAVNFFLRILQRFRGKFTPKFCAILVRFKIRAHSARTAKKIIANRSDARCTLSCTLQRLRDLERRRTSFFCAVLRAFRDDFMKFYAELSRNFRLIFAQTRPARPARFAATRKDVQLSPVVVIEALAWSL